MIIVLLSWSRTFPCCCGLVVVTVVFCLLCRDVIFVVRLFVLVVVIKVVAIFFCGGLVSFGSPGQGMLGCFVAAKNASRDPHGLGIIMVVMNGYCY